MTSNECCEMSVTFSGPQDIRCGYIDGREEDNENSGKKLNTSEHAGVHIDCSGNSKENILSSRL